MNLTPVSELRRAAKGKPTLRELAKKMGCVTANLSRFENGQSPLSSKLLAAYARAIGASVREVKAAFALAAYTYHQSRAQELKREILVVGKTGTGR